MTSLIFLCRSKLRCKLTYINECTLLWSASRNLLQPLVLFHFRNYSVWGMWEKINFPVTLVFHLVKDCFFLSQRIEGEPELIKSRIMYFYLPPSFGETFYKQVMHVPCMPMFNVAETSAGENTLNFKCTCIYPIFSIHVVFSLSWMHL